MSVVRYRVDVSVDSWWWYLAIGFTMGEYLSLEISSVFRQIRSTEGYVCGLAEGLAIPPALAKALVFVILTEVYQIASSPTW